MEGLEFCNDCPFFCVKVNKKKKTEKLVCGPYDYEFKESDYADEVNINVPKWCGNKKRYNEG
jgi:hypothetical protein